jgi:hypothetical protein
MSEIEIGGALIDSGVARKVLESGYPKKEGLLKDFDAIAPPKRVAKIGGEEVDVSIFSTRATLKLIEYSQKYNFQDTECKPVENLSPGQFEDMAEVVAVACQRTNKKITKDWLLDNCDPVTLLEFVKYVIGPVTERMKALNGGGNPSAGAGDQKNV